MVIVVVVGGRDGMVVVGEDKGSRRIIKETIQHSHVIMSDFERT
jgi:hypothetical protein